LLRVTAGEGLQALQSIALNFESVLLEHFQEDWDLLVQAKKIHCLLLSLLNRVGSLKLKSTLVGDVAT